MKMPPLAIPRARRCIFRAQKSFFICALAGLLLAVAGMTARAQFTFATNQSGSITITGYNGYASSVVIPATIDGLAVTEIGTNAFEGMTNAIDVVVLGNLALVDGGAFADCTNLEAVYFGGSAPQASATAFSGSSHTSVYYESGAAGWGTLLGGRGAYAMSPVSYFKFQTNGSTLTISGYTGTTQFLTLPAIAYGYPVTAIGASAFSSKGTLIQVIIPTTVTSLGSSAFYGCTSMINAYLPIGITNVPTAAFENCSGLTQVAWGCPFVSIAAYAYANCTRLKSIALPPGLTNVAAYAFANCTALSSITVGGGLVDLYAVFGGCTNLTNAIVTNGTTSIGYHEFEEFQTLETVTVPASVTNLGTFCFVGSPISAVYFLGDAPTGTPALQQSAIAYYLPGTTGWTPLMWNEVYSELLPFQTAPSVRSGVAPPTGNFNSLTITNYIGTNGYVQIPSYLFGQPISDVGPQAFAGCSTLTNLVISYGVTNVDDSAFMDCANLIWAAVPNTVSTIADSAFAGCLELSQIYFSTNAPVSAAIASNAFEGDTQATIYYPGGTARWTAEFAGLPTVAATTASPFYFITNSTGGITITGYGYSTTNTSIIVPAYITGRIVNNIASLGGGEPVVVANVTVLCTVTNIGTNACLNLTTLTNIVLPKTLLNIAKDAFSGSGLKSVSIPGSVTNVGPDAFVGCFWLTNVVIQEGVTSLGAYDFNYCTNLRSLHIPASVTSIGTGAFEACYGLSTVYFAGNAPGNPASYFLPNGTTVCYLPWTSGWDSFAANSGAAAVPWEPVIATGDGIFGVQGNRFGFNVTSTNNFSVVVQACANLASPEWVPLQTVAITNGSAYFSDPTWTNFPNRFYGLTMP